MNHFVPSHRSTGFLLSLTALALVAVPQVSHAEQRALLVGVGKYQVSGIDLPGIDLDLERVADTLKIMGFEDSQIRTLLNSEATSDNVIQQFDEWLTQGVTKEDRIVFYYSGHGSFVPDQDGDEPDEVDEVLVTHNVRRRTVNGQATLTGVVRDDEIAKLIRSSPSENILVIVDACHSGTMTRNIFLDNKSLSREPVFEKTFVYEGMPTGNDGGGLTRDLSMLTKSDAADQDNFVSLSAAADDEQAIGTVRGGVFTIGLTTAISESARASQRITINELREKAAAYITEKVDERRRHTPQVTGSSRLADGALQVVPLKDGRGPMWQRLEALVGSGQYFAMQTAKRDYAVDEAIEFSLNVPQAGYLNLVSVDAADTATVLFPNRFDANNYVAAGEFQFPSAALPFELAAAEPLGPTLVLAFVSEEPVDFREQGFEGRDEDGEYGKDAVFTAVSYGATRAISVRARPEESEQDPSDEQPAPEPEDNDEAPSKMYASSLEINVVAR